MSYINLKEVKKHRIRPNPVNIHVFTLQHKRIKYGKNV